MTLIARFFSVAVFCALLSSCENGQNPFSRGAGAGGTDPYVSNYGNDGAYNPYPGQSGHAQGGAGTYEAPPTYTQPPAPVEADPYSFGNASTPTASSPSRRTASSGSGSNTTPKRASTTASKASSSSTARKSGGSYKVAKGDTLYAIARSKGTTVAKLKSANGLTSDVIRPGQSLKIP